MNRTIISIILAAMGLAGCTKVPRAAEENPTTQFVFVKIPESILPIERGEKYEDPLERTLREAALGEVTGGGSQSSELDEEGNRDIEWIGIDVDLTDFERGMEVLKNELIRLGVPKGTVIEYMRDNTRHSEAVK